MIFSEEINQNCKYLCSYFEKIFEKGTSRLSHSIILYGLNTQLVYDFAFELARILNCQKDKDISCECLNCKWVRENAHPAIKVYSNLSEKTSSKESKIAITVDQISQLKSELVISSEYKRVYIFCAQKEENGITLPLPLTSKILPQASSNALLKSIEEPPADTYFIFICKDKNDLLPTIISRSQSFYVPSFEEQLPIKEGLEDIFKYYPCTDYLSSKNFITLLQQWQSDNKMDIEETINYIQNYLREIILTNIDNKSVVNTVTSDIIKFEDARAQAQNSFKDSIIWENLIYKIYKD